MGITTGSMSTDAVVYESQTFYADKLSLLVLIPCLWFGLPILLLQQLLGPTAAVAFTALALLPRLLWRSSQPAEGSNFLLANLIYWNLVYPCFFGSPFFLLGLCYVQPYTALPLVLLYIIYIKLLARPDLRGGQPWRFFSSHDWGIVALRRYLRLRLCVSPALHQRCPSKPVVVGIHPHGVASDYRVLMDGLLYEALPGRHLFTLGASVLFSLPLVRELALWTRTIDASKSVAKRALESGVSLAVIPGGEAEQMRTQTGVEDVYITKRVGFVKLAMQHEAALVPCYAFGTTDLYDITESQHQANTTGFLWTLSKKFGVAMPRFRGRFGFLPKRKACCMVFGDPFEPECKEPKKPTDGELVAALALYMRKLKALFDEHKEAMGCGDRELVMT